MYTGGQVGLFKEYNFIILERRIVKGRSRYIKTNGVWAIQSIASPGTQIESVLRGCLVVAEVGGVRSGLELTMLSEALLIARGPRCELWFWRPKAEEATAATAAG